MEKLMIFSNTAIIVDWAANVMKTKNKTPKIRPPTIWLKMLGRVMNTRPGPSSGIDAECKAGRENNQSCEKSNQCVQKADIDCFPCQGVVFTDVAAENRHRTDAEAQGKERLSHCGENRVADAVFCKSGKIGNQIKAQSLEAPGSVTLRIHRMSRMRKRQLIIALVIPLHTFLQTETADKKSSAEPQEPSRMSCNRGGRACH